MTSTSRPYGICIHFACSASPRSEVGHPCRTHARTHAAIRQQAGPYSSIVSSHRHIVWPHERRKLFHHMPRYWAEARSRRRLASACVRACACAKTAGYAWTDPELRLPRRAPNLDFPPSHIQHRELVGQHPSVLELRSRGIYRAGVVVPKYKELVPTKCDVCADGDINKMDRRVTISPRPASRRS